MTPAPMSGGNYLNNIVDQIKILLDPIVEIDRVETSGIPASISENSLLAILHEGGESERWAAGGVRREEHDIRLAYFVRQQDQPTSDELMRSVWPQVIDILDRDITLNGTCVTSEIVSYETKTEVVSTSRFRVFEFRFMVRVDITVNWES